MRLKQLLGQGVRSLDQPFDVSFPERGLVRVSGVSGVGKTTLLSLPAFALGLTGVPSGSKLRSWHGTFFEVEAVFTVDNHELTIQRIPLKLWVEDELIAGNTSALEEHLAQQIRFPLEVIQVLGYRRQRQRSAFLSLSDSAKKTFLSAPAGIDALEGKLKAGYMRVVAAKEETETAQNLLSIAMAGAEACPEPEDEGQLEASLARANEALQLSTSVAYNAKTELERLSASQREKDALQQSRIVDLSKKIETVREAIRQATLVETESRQVWERNDRAIDRALMQAANANNELDRACKELAKWVSTASALEAAVPECGTCLRPWPEAPPTALTEAISELKQAGDRLKQLKATIKAGPIAEAGRTPWISDDKIPKLQELERVLVTRHAEAVKQSTEAGIAEARQNVISAEAEVKRTTREVEISTERLFIYQKAVVNMQRFSDKVTEAETVLQQKKIHLDEQTDTLDAVKGFVGRYFDQMLISVADQVNALLTDVPNVRNCSISFRSEVTTKDGEVSRTAIVPVLSIEGHEVGLGDHDGASGGMLSAIELAIDLGVLRVIEERLGQKLGWLTLDEPFSGLDSKCREACVELLRKEAEERLVLITDHQGEIDGLFDRTLEIVVSEKGSLVKWAD